MIRTKAVMQLYLQAVPNYTVQRKNHQGRVHLVVPVVMMVEGVHSGSHGPLLHTMEELGKFTEAWNGIPVTIDHPEIEGHNVSANQPDIIDARTVGRVYNTQVDGTKLKAEVWLDENKLRQVSSVTLARVNSSQPVEVSVGVFSDEDEEEGEWNGETYNAIARNHRPDHLALLPGGTGACSIEDGCGIRANKKGGKNVKEKEWLTTMKSLKDEGLSIEEILDNTSEGLVERLEALRSKIDSMDSNDTMNFLREAYDDYVVYETRLRIGGSKLYKQTYSFNSGIVELTGNPVEVQKKVEYVVINNKGAFTRTKPVKMEVNKMAENKCPKCVEKINALIANTESGFVEADREWLDTLSEVALDKITPKVITKTEKEIVEVNKLTEEQKADLAFAAKQRKAKRTALVNGIQANADNKAIWTDDILNAMSEDGLERVYKTVTKEEAPTDYSLQSGKEVVINENKIKPLLPTGMAVKDEPKK
jgi:hypothetical protein